MAESPDLHNYIEVDINSTLEIDEKNQTTDKLTSTIPQLSDDLREA